MEYGLIKMIFDEIYNSVKKYNKVESWFNYFRNLVKRHYIDCAVCRKNRATIVHHIYPNSRSEKYHDLVLLCEKCHWDIHSKKIPSNKLKQELLIKQAQDLFNE